MAWLGWFYASNSTKYKRSTTYYHPTINPHLCTRQRPETRVQRTPDHSFSFKRVALSNRSFPCGATLWRSRVVGGWWSLWYPANKSRNRHHSADYTGGGGHTAVKGGEPAADIGRIPTGDLSVVIQLSLVRWGWPKRPPSLHLQKRTYAQITSFPLLTTHLTVQLIATADHCPPFPRGWNIIVEGIGRCWYR